VNGVHDLGGMHGFGPVEPEADEPVFHAEWERRAFALTLAAGALGRWNMDMARHARERVPPAEQLSSTYYERWLSGLERLLVEQGLLTDAELHGGADRRVATEPRALQEGALTAGGVGEFLRRRLAARRDDPVPPRFHPGDAVVARNLNPSGHTRCPRYVRGRRGTVDVDRGVFVLADTNAMGDGENPQHVYSVRFTARELWGPQASSRDHVCVDLWDGHLDPA